MSTFTMQGTLWIDLVDLYAWLGERGIEFKPAHRLKYSIDDDGLQVIQEGSARTVEAAELWAWLIDKQVPKGLHPCEIRFGVPKIESDTMVVTFAAGSETAPEGWSPPPPCLAEWKVPA